MKLMMLSSFATLVTKGRPSGHMEVEAAGWWMGVWVRLFRQKGQPPPPKTAESPHPSGNVPF